MQKIQIKLQKPIIMLALAVAVLTFIYALGFATDLYPLFKFTDKDSRAYVSGSELFSLIQPFNKELLAQGLILILLAAANFLVMSHTRRKYYLSNYIAGVAYSGYTAFVAVRMIQYVSIFKAEYLKIDFETYEKYHEMYSVDYIKSTRMFDLGTVLCVLMFLAAIIVLVNLVIKTIWMAAEKKAMAA